jgi:predicted nucleic acid-binding protein
MMALDASVIAKWFLPEPGSREAAALLEPSQAFLAPQLLCIEVPAAITRKWRTRELPEATVRNALAEWDATQNAGVVTLVPDDEVLEEAAELSLRLRHALQDCLYLAVASRYRIPLVTADRTFHERASPSHPNVRLLPGCQRD